MHVVPFNFCMPACFFYTYCRPMVDVGPSRKNGVLVNPGEHVPRDRKKSVRFQGAFSTTSPTRLVETKLVDGREVVLQDPHLKMFEHRKYVEIA